MLELIASTYGAPDEVATAYRDTEVKVKAALRTPPPRRVENPSATRRFFGIFLDARAYTSLFYMLLTLATGILYFVLVVVGLSLSAGLAILIIGVPFFLVFIGITRVVSLGEGRLIEAITGERMPRRPVHPGPPGGWWARIGAMLSDARTWTTLLYFVLMLPLGILLLRDRHGGSVDRREPGAGAVRGDRRGFWLVRAMARGHTVRAGKSLDHAVRPLVGDFALHVRDRGVRAHAADACGAGRSGAGMRGWRRRCSSSRGPERRKVHFGGMDRLSRCGVLRRGIAGGIAWRG